MRVAIILTGALRTIRKTIHFFKQNLVNGTPEVDVFACVQNDTHESNEEWTLWFKEQIPIVSIVWFSLENNSGWVEQREKLLEHMQLDVSWKAYLRRSGSMIEYAQLQLASMKMVQWEHDHGAYDYIVRARTDSIFCKPIDFHWLRWTDEEVESRMNTVVKEMEESRMDTSYRLRYFMSTIVSDDLIPNLSYIHATTYASDADVTPRASDTDVTPRASYAKALHAYIKEGRYILTFRKNNLYIVRRSLFHLIPALGTMYGQFKSPYSDAWWFNAEGQFTSICYHAGLTTYDYNTDFEDRSVEVNGWNEANFFDGEMNVVNPRMMYCVVRR